jgi:hypothetical protein
MDEILHIVPCERHDAWAKTSLEPMRDWRIALDQAMPAIISAVKAEG